jgi:ankyrin repeat protein
MALVKYFIEEEKVDVDCKEYGNPVICAASQQGNNEMIEYFSSIGININAKDNYGECALHWAVRYRRFETLKLLISLGCDFNAENNNEDTALRVAHAWNRKEIVDFLKQVELK